MNQKGFTLIELLFAIALSALFLPALVFVFSFSLGAASQGENYTQAYTIAQEQMEAIYLLKDDWDWENDAVPGTYQLDKSGTTWSLEIAGSPLEEINGYTAIIEVSSVYRIDENGDDISDIVPPTGDLDDIDENTRKITVQVSWKEKGEDTSIDLVSYVTKH